MNNLEFDYYLIRPVFDGYIPAVRDDDDYEPYGDPTRLRLASPIPKQPRMVDYHSLDGGTAVYSQKVYDVLEPMKIKGLTLHPAIIKDKRGKEHSGYYIAYLGNKIESFDREKSVYKLMRSGKKWMSVDKIVINTELLSKIPLEDRLIYESFEHSGKTLYHKSVVDVIMSVNPEGVTFIPVETWHQGMQFT